MRAKISSVVHPGGVEQVSFDNVDDCLAAARIPNDARFFGSNFASAQEAGNPRFAGTSTFAEAVDLAVAGWPDGLRQAEALRANLCAVLGTRNLAPELMQSVAGFAPCIPAAVSGDPESMFAVDWRETPAMGRIVKIVYNNCVSADIDKRTIMLRGAICLALVDTLESSGFRCEVQIGNCVKQGGQNPIHEVMITLKRAEDPLAIDSLAFWLVHPSAFRRMIFSIWQNAWPDTCEFPGLGRPCELREELRGDIYLNEAHLACVNDETAVPFLKEELKKFGVEFEN